MTATATTELYQVFRTMRDGRYGQEICIGRGTLDECLGIGEVHVRLGIGQDNCVEGFWVVCPDGQIIRK